MPSSEASHLAAKIPPRPPEGERGGMRISTPTTRTSKEGEVSEPHHIVQRRNAADLENRTEAEPPRGQVKSTIPRTPKTCNDVLRCPPTPCPPASRTDIMRFWHQNPSPPPPYRPAFPPRPPAPKPVLSCAVGHISFFPAPLPLHSHPACFHEIRRNSPARYSPPPRESEGKGKIVHGAKRLPSSTYNQILSFISASSLALGLLLRKSGICR
ncbi:hypothetical protein F5144DRAFT_174820 [Chaetomium tenue]|uniref:Uncharacterized protein n=1 Tax=Chaetomium tenue TaxID=1854479 RepID=A0ACB7PB56_9PEZI|nr:hypothetical protein F5144DRAFT_174820 [Chaetomium globosum]